jgi:hypothetical protein
MTGLVCASSASEGIGGGVLGTTIVAAVEVFPVDKSSGGGGVDEGDEDDSGVEDGVSPMNGERG